MLVALTHMSWKVLARIVRDLIAWDNARPADLGNQLHRQRMARPPDERDCGRDGDPASAGGGTGPSA